MRPTLCSPRDRRQRPYVRVISIVLQFCILIFRNRPLPRCRSVMTIDFKSALAARVDTMLEACTKCGKCFDACPIKEPAGVAGADPQAAIAGVLDIVRTGNGPELSRKWASACVLSGECIKACDYGVNPRFLLNMARVAMARSKNEPPERRRIGVEDFRKVSRDVTHLSKMQLTDDVLERLGQKLTARPADGVPDDLP